MADEIGLGDKPLPNPPKRKHRPTGHTRGGRRIYDAHGQILETIHVYSPELASEILDRMAHGESVAAICRSRPDFPDPRRVRSWKWDVEGFASAYARAQILQAEALGDEIIEGIKDRETDPSVRRVEFDMRKWVMSKLAPLTYGDKLTVAGDPDAPILHVHQLDDTLSSLSEPELAALERFTEERLRAIEAATIEHEADKPE